MKGVPKNPRNVREGPEGQSRQISDHGMTLPPQLKE